jgi:hypothetical protein
MYFLEKLRLEHECLTNHEKIVKKIKLRPSSLFQHVRRCNRSASVYRFYNIPSYSRIHSQKNTAKPAYSETAGDKFFSFAKWLLFIEVFEMWQISLLQFHNMVILGFIKYNIMSLSKTV